MDDENRVLQQLLEVLRDGIKNAADSTGIFTKAISKTEEKLRSLENSYKTGAEGMDELTKSIKSGSESALDNIGAFKNFQANIMKSGKTVDNETQARINYIRRTAIGESVMQGFLNVTQTTATALVDLAISGFKTLVQELQGTGNAFSLVSKLSIQTIDATNKVNQALSESGSALGAVLTVALPGQLKIFGVALMGMAEFFGFLSNKTAELAKFGVETLNAEVQKTIKVFADNSKAGIFFGSGMSALAKDITDAGLSYRDFMGALRNSAADLATLGGNAGAGAIQVKRVFMNLGNLREQFLNLGVSTEEQVEATATYMAMLARADSLRGKSDAEVAKGLNSYITNLKVITSITGEEAKAAEARARKAAEQLAVQQTLIDLQAQGGDAAQKFQEAIKRVGPELTPALQQLLVEGIVTNPELAKALALTPTLMLNLEKYARDIKDPAVSAGQALSNYGTSVTESGEALKKETADAATLIGRAALLVGAHGEASAIVSAQQRELYKFLQNDAKDAENRVDQTKKTNDELTNSVSKATLAFQNMQANLEKELNPALIKFSIFVESQISETNKRIVAALRQAGIGLPAAPPVTTAQSAANAAAAAAGKAYASESTDASALSAKAIQEQLAANAARQREIAEQNKKRAQTQKADGGITDGPTTVGEAGPEAVIPLKTTSVPVNIDWSPLVSAIKEQTLLSQDMLDKLGDIKDYTDRTARNTA
jgi:hypothetical protein